MAAIGWNTVRLLLSWSRVEPQPGVYDDAYLEQVRAAVRLLASRGLYSIIDLHQDAWGADARGAAGRDAACPDPSPRFGWDGAPGWATLDDGAPRCAQAGVRELSPAVLRRVRHLLRQRRRPGRHRHPRPLRRHARRTSRACSRPRPGVAGYDLMNEPNAFGDRAAGGPVRRCTREAVRGHPRRRERGGQRTAPDPLRAVGAVVAIGSGAPPDFARDRDVVYAPHIYTGGFDGEPITAAAFAVARDEAAGFGGAPVLSGEWGADPRRASDPGRSLLPRASESAGRVPLRRHAVDLARVVRRSAQGGRLPRRPHALRVGRVRGRLHHQRGDRPAPGPGRRSSRAPTCAPRPAGCWRAATSTPRARSRPAAPAPPAAAELLAFYPGSRHGEPTLTTSGLDDVQIVLAPGDNLYLIARATGGDWSWPPNSRRGIAPRSDSSLHPSRARRRRRGALKEARPLRRELPGNAARQAWLATAPIPSRRRGVLQLIDDGAAPPPRARCASG